jgi:rhamnogalacturonyl hydrolase YesR
MVPPFLAYYGALSHNQTLVLEAYNQIKLYRSHLRDGQTGLWKHIVLGGEGEDPGFWATGVSFYLCLFFRLFCRYIRERGFILNELAY